jgi:hypothetical protein
LENSKNLSDDNKTVKTGLPMKNFTKDNLQIIEKKKIFLKSFKRHEKDKETKIKKIISK